MHYKDLGIALIGAFVSGSLAAPAEESSVQRAPTGFPFISPSGSGNANINLVLGGGILPTLTIAGGIAGESNKIAFGASSTIGIGGGPLPTGLVGGGAGIVINPFDILAQASATASDGGGLNGLVPTVQVGMINNADLYYQYSSGIHLGGGMNGSGSMIDGYGGILIPSSSFIASFGGNFGFNVENGAVKTNTAAPSANTPITTPSKTL